MGEEEKSKYYCLGKQSMGGRFPLHGCFGAHICWQTRPPASLCKCTFVCSSCLSVRCLFPIPRRPLSPRLSVFIFALDQGLHLFDAASRLWALEALTSAYPWSLILYQGPPKPPPVLFLLVSAFLVNAFSTCTMDPISDIRPYSHRGFLPLQETSF